MSKRSRRALAFLLFPAGVSSAAAALAASASTPPTAKLPAGMRQVTSVEGITEYRLDNGLRVLLFPDPSKQTATVNITYLVGSRHEGYGESGMAHLLEHMVFKGTPKHPNIPQELTAHGARPNGTTWFDRTNYFETFAATDENLDWALDLEADRMVNSYIAKKDLDSEFSVVRNEFEVGENSPQEVLTDRMMSTAYLWHNYGKSTIGSREDIERVPIENLQAFYHKWYQPDNAMLVVAGKFDDARTLQRIAATFGKLERPKRALPNTWTVEPPQDGERTVTLRRVGDLQVAGALYHVPAGSHADYAAVDLLTYILGDTPSGMLYKSLVETKKASSVFGFSFALRDPTALIVGAQVRAENSLDETRDILLRTVADAAAASPSEDAVRRARDSRLKNWETTMRNSERAAIALSGWAAMGDWRLMFVHRDRLEKVTPADVHRVAQAYLKPENSTVGLFLPAKESVRVQVPARPDVASFVEAYKGREAMAQGEEFDPSPAAVEARIQRIALAPGIKLVLLPKKTRGATVSASMTFHLGDEASLQGRGTDAELAGSMLMRGTKTKTRQQIRDAADQLKAQIGVNGNATAALVSIETIRDNFAGALTLATEALTTPAFPEAEFELLRQETLAGLEDSKNDPRQKAFTTLQKHLNPWPPADPRYANTSEEKMQLVQAAKLDGARSFWQDFYGASAAEIVVVGDFDPASVKAQIEQSFANWKSAKPFTRLANTYQDRPVARVTVETPDKESAVFAAGQRVRMRDDDPDYPAMVLGNFMTGGGFLNSRLAARLRQKEGLSYGVNSSFNASSFDQDGSFGSFAIYAPQNSDKLVAAYGEEITRILQSGFTADEIAAAKKGWLQGRTVSRSTDRELARMLGSREYSGRKLLWDEAFEKSVDALSGDQILAAMRKHLDEAKISFVQAGDWAKAKGAGTGVTSRSPQ